MSSGPAYGRERERGGGGGGDRETSYRGGGGGYNNRGGGFRGRGGGPGGYKPRRYWDNDDYYKEERDHGGRGGRRRRSFSRSRSRSYSSRSRSRSPPPQRRGRSRSPPKPDEASQRPAEQIRHVPVELHEPYVPTKEPDHAWASSRMQIPPEYMTHSNGQVPVAHNPVNPYGNVDTAYPSHYHEGPPPGVASQQQLGFGYGHNTISMNPIQYPPQQTAHSMYPPHPREINQAAPVSVHPPSITDTKLKEEGNEESASKKKKDKRKKKKRHHSSSSSSSSSDDSTESRRRRKSKKEQGSSESSSEEEKKDSNSSSGLTTQQKDALLKQREGYQTKLEILEREIAKLLSKEDELIRSRADRQLIQENLNLQAELKGRCKAVAIVLEKIDEVLKDGSKSAAAVEKPKPVAPPPVLAALPPASKVPVSDLHSLEAGRKVPYEFFDNGLHWCRLCNVFPQTMEQMLEHFHSKEHKDQMQQIGIDEKPWRKRNAVTEAPVPGARKIPYRGIPFFTPVQGWFCRLCNDWMGDPQCAVEHLKTDVHNSNYMNFLEEHPDWEKKWVNDRERAIGVSGKQDPVPAMIVKKSRFDDRNSRDKADRKVDDDMDSGKSIRVQMRNSLKGEGRDSISQFTTAPINEAQPNKDSGLEEWMIKPKVAVDLIDTQKFAAIVRQKHGAKDKEVIAKEGKPTTVDVKSAPTAPALLKEKDYKREKDDRRRPDKVEMQISSRETKDRERYNRDRDSRGSRRRSRSRSRSRSRDRRYNRRRSRSRSRSRDRSDRDRRDREHRERPDSVKETVKKLPMIGKMPLYKRPIINREKPEADRIKADTAATTAAVTLPAVGFLAKQAIIKSDDAKTELYPDNSANSAYTYDAHSMYSHGLVSNQEAYVMTSEYGTDPGITSHKDNTFKDLQQSVETTEDAPSDEVKEDKGDAPAALPDDFQQALDIIYAVNTGGSGKPGMPQPVPRPSAVPGTNGVDDDAPPGVSEYGDYSSMGANGYGSYMGYQPYQQSFDGYAPVGYEELDDGPPGVGDANITAGTPLGVPPPSAETGKHEKVGGSDPPPPGDDDMDDLRMLGIDVDDTAVVFKK